MPATRTSNAAEEICRLELKRVVRELAMPLATGGGRVILQRPSVLLRVTRCCNALRQETGSTTGAAMPQHGTHAEALPEFARQPKDAAPQIHTLKADALRAGAMDKTAATGAPFYNASGTTGAGSHAPQPQTIPCYGYGEAATLPWFGTETDDEAFAALATLGKEIRCDGIAATLDTLGKSTPCARWALECALAQAGLATDSEASHRALPDGNPHQDTAGCGAPAENGQPSSDGTNMPRQQALHVTLPVAALLPSAPFSIGSDTGAARQTPSAACGEITLSTLRTALQSGFTTFKLKIGIGSIEEELPLVHELLGYLRSEAARSNTKRPLKLRLDANGSLDAALLRQWLGALEKDADFIDFIEQPLPVGAEAQTADICSGSPIAFALDESLTSFASLREAAERWPQAVLVVKPSLLGERAGFIAWRSNRQNSARRIIYSTALETGIGLHHALQLAALDPQAGKDAAGFGTGRLFADDGLGCPPAAAFTTVAIGATCNSAPANEGGEASATEEAYTACEEGDRILREKDAGMPAAACANAQQEAVWKRA